ncbi:hypothetical protein Syun_022018 [Stephania yunnanensis]|uniref:Uncharacterized protein n=1 Tax=Stephania yunnanensis TaxID=152371 RepID=A0AAP0IGQ9_9MAGN
MSELEALKLALPTFKNCWSTFTTLDLKTNILSHHCLSSNGLRLQTPKKGQQWRCDVTNPTTTPYLSIVGATKKKESVSQCRIIKGDLGVLPNNELEPVAAYVTTEGNWEWSKFQEYLPAEILLKIASTHPPCHNLGDDGVYWRKSPSGYFSVSSAYREILQHTTVKNKAWKLIWSWHG